jgi:hypothetical protein
MFIKIYLQPKMEFFGCYRVNRVMDDGQWAVPFLKLVSCTGTWWSTHCAAYRSICMWASESVLSHTLSVDISHWNLNRRHSSVELSRVTTVVSTAAVLRCGKQMEKLPHYKFPGQSLSKNRETQFGRDYGPVARQTNTWTWTTGMTIS